MIPACERYSVAVPSRLRSWWGTLSSIAIRLNDLPIFDAGRWPHREWIGRIIAILAVSSYSVLRLSALPGQLAASEEYGRFLLTKGSSPGEIQLIEGLRLAFWACEMGILVVYILAFLIRRNARGVARGFMEVVYPFLLSAFPMAITFAPPTYGRFVPTTSEFYAAGLAAMLALMTAGAAFNLMGLWSLRRAFTITTEARTLVCEGLFRWVRHPLYAGHFVMFFGVLLAHLHLWTAIVYLVFVAGQVLRSRLEERKLERAFPEYREYRERVGMFFPQLRRVGGGRTLRTAAMLGAALCCASPAHAGALDAESFTLPNGMTFVLVQRGHMATVAAGWVVPAGSASEVPGETGLAHYLEHVMFHGTRTLGTRDTASEAPMLAEEDALRAAILKEDDPALTQRLAEVSAAQRRLGVANEFDAQYARGGASGVNAVTTEDFTAFFAQLPAERIELWFWMESERLEAPVFRGFHEEREVIRAERRQRLASDARQRALEQSLGALWPEHPYGWPAMGLEDELAGLTRPAARRFFERHYRPAKLVAVLVGPLDRAHVEALARRYFGRLASGPALASPRPPAPTTGARRLATSWAGPPLVHLEYRTVSPGCADVVGLDLLAGVIDSRRGSFWREVVSNGPARALRAAHSHKRWGGSFSVDLEAWDTVSLDALEARWQQELERLVAEGLPADELDRVRNQLTADSYRRLENPYLLVVELLMAAGRGDWRDPLTWSQRARAVTTSDLGRLAATYLVAERGVIARWLPSGEP